MIEIEEDILDLDSDDSTAKRTSRALSKRRRSSELLDESVLVADNAFVNILSSASNASPPPPDLRKRSSQWTEETGQQSSGKTSGRFRFKKDKEVKNEETEIQPMIPDLDDMVDEDLARKTAVAPEYGGRKMVSYDELRDQEELSKFKQMDNIDLSALVASIAPKRVSKEEDRPWTWDSLISEVAFERGTETVEID